MRGGERDVERLAEHRQADGDADDGHHAPPLVRHPEHPLRPPRDAEEHHREGAEVGDARADDPVRRDEQEVEGHADDCAALPVTTQLNWVRFVRPRPMETTMKPPKRHSAEREQRRRRPTRRRRRASSAIRTIHGASRPRPSAAHEATKQEIREHVRVRAAARARRPRSSRRTRASAPRKAVSSSTIADAMRDADRVDADLARVGELEDEEAVAEVQHPEREHRRHERQSEPVHRRSSGRSIVRPSCSCR